MLGELIPVAGCGRGTNEGPLNEGSASERLDPELQVPVMSGPKCVLFPGQEQRFYVDRPTSVRAVIEAHTALKRVLVIAQRDLTVPDGGDLFDIGTLATIMELIDLDEGPVGYQIVDVRGDERARLLELTQRIPFFTARVARVRDEPTRGSPLDRARLMSAARQAAGCSLDAPLESLRAALAIQDPGRLMDALAACLVRQVEDGQKVLEALSLNERAERLIHALEIEARSRSAEARPVLAELGMIVRRWKVDRLPWR